MSLWHTYVEELLYLYDCVTIPGFGSLVATYREARVDTRTGSITPPEKQIVFNSLLTRNDGLLAHWISRREGSDFSRASKRVRHYCDELKTSLNRGETVALGTIGTFRKDRRNRICFDSGNRNFLADSQGMLPVSPALCRKKAIPPAEVRTGSSLIGQWAKYGLSAAAVAGIVVITQSDIFKSTTLATLAGIHTSTRVESYEVQSHKVISPEQDFVDFTPEF